MSVTSFAANWLVAAAMSAALVVAAIAVRRRLFPGWTGAWARLAETLTATSILVVCSQATGLVGLFRPGPLTVAIGVLAGALAAWSRRSTGEGPSETAHGAATLERDWVVTAGLVVVAVATAWFAVVELTLRKGMYDFDTLVYHAPFAARFARSGGVTEIHQIATGQAISYHPASAELLQAIGIAVFDSDVLTPLSNVAWLAVAVVAAWCLASEWRAAPPAAALVAVLCGAPGVVESQAGTAGNDLAGLALLLASAALLSRTATRSGAKLLAALAAGLAVGVKLTLLVPVLMLSALAVAWAPRGQRAVAAIAWIVPAAATGGFWYARNVAHTGNPVPALDLGIGPFRLEQPRMPVLDRFSDTVLLDATVDRWSSVYHAGLRGFFGPFWWLLVAGAIAGIVIALTARRDRRRRGLGIVASVSLAAYLVTPTAGEPVVFEANLRYALPALALGLVLLGVWVATLHQVARRLALAVTLGTAAITVADSRPWSLPSWEFALAVAVAAAGLGVTTLALARIQNEPWVRRGLALLAAVSFVAAPFAAWGVQQRYLDGRYADAGGNLGSAFRLLRESEGERIAVSGAIEHYPFFGSTFENHVQYIGDERPDTSFLDIESCPLWARTVRDGHYTVLVVSRSPIEVDRFGPPPEEAWAANDPAFALSARSGHTTVWAVGGDPDPEAC